MYQLRKVVNDNKFMKLFCIFCIYAIFCWANLYATSLHAKDPAPEIGYGLEKKKSVKAKEFMISVANPLAAKAGYDILAAGGTAADAMIAVQLMLNLVEPQSSGIGGGAFLLYWDASSKTLSTFDARETAPASAVPERFLDEKGEKIPFRRAITGGQSVGVPGILRLMEVTHALYGKMPWADLFRPAIQQSEEGFAVSARMAHSIQSMVHFRAGLDRFPQTRNYFFDDSGNPIKAGHLLKNPAFAQTLRVLAKEGADAFYSGEIARDIIEAVSQTSILENNITMEDMAAYRVKLRPAICPSYRQFQICGMGPPTSGGLTVGQILGILQNFDLKSVGWNENLAHLYAEAAKLAYADRAYFMADSDFVPVPVTGLLDPAYLAGRSDLVSKDLASAQRLAGEPPTSQDLNLAPSQNPDRKGTSHFVIRDQYGNALSMTSTIETAFGSRVFVRGFLLNNELTDFDRQPVVNGRLVANRVEGAKRPRSSMAPTIVMKDDEPYLLIGSPGGSQIINYVAKSLIAILDWEMDPQDALETGHFAHRNSGVLTLEEGTLTAAYADRLKAMGHQVELKNMNSGLQAILIKDGELLGAADPRREGVAMGR